MKCDHPFYVYGGVDQPGEYRVPVPCGRCPVCKKRRVDEWVFRLTQEMKEHEFCHFVTLTFDTQTVGISPNGFMTLRRGFDLVKRKKPGKDGSEFKQVSRCDFVKFMKRLRKLCNAKLKYYFCGEYGERKHRPHYHAIIFGVPDVELYRKAWTLDGKPIGGIHIGTVTSDSIAYVMKYIDKSSWTPKHARDDRVPEFAGMSKGLGENYLTPEMLDYHKADISRLYVTSVNGKRSALPRYYRNRVYSKAERSAQLPIIQKAMELQEAKERANFKALYGQTDLTFEEYKSRQKLGRYHNFIKQKKSRDI